MQLLKEEVHEHFLFYEGFAEIKLLRFIVEDILMLVDIVGGGWEPLKFNALGFRYCGITFPIRYFFNGKIVIFFNTNNSKMPV